MMKKKIYIKPELEIYPYTPTVMQDASADFVNAKEQNFEADERLFNTDTKNIWDTEEEEE
jgi:hypothetical protein